MNEGNALPGPRFVAINRFYWPDQSATSQLLTDLAEHMAKQGASVTVIASRLNYDDPSKPLSQHDDHHGVTIKRIRTTRFGRSSLPGRAIDYLTFYVAAFFALLRTIRPGDILITKTDPPMISIVAAVTARLRGAHLVNWCQDLFPEIAGALGMRWAVGPLGRFLIVLRNWSLRAARVNVVLDQDMAARVRGFGVPASSIQIIENWCDPGIHPVERSENALAAAWGIGEETVIGYSGNLGRAHRVDDIVALVKHLRGEPNLQFLFIGGGHGRARLEAELADDIASGFVMVKPYQDRERLSESLSLPDVHLIALEPACDGLIFPSKLYGILAVGRGVLAVCSEDGALSQTIRDGPFGRVLSPTSSQSVAQPFLIQASWGAKARDHHEGGLHHGIPCSLLAWSDTLLGLSRQAGTLPTIASTIGRERA